MTFEKIGNRLSLAAIALALTCALVPTTARADEGGVSFWLPGQQGSLAAAPAAPGWSLPFVYYHVSADASASEDFELGGTIAAGVDARADLLLVVPTFTFTNPVAGGQAALGFAAVFADTRVSADLTRSRKVRDHRIE